jgi:hexosaminidase
MLKLIVPVVLAATAAVASNAPTPLFLRGHSVIPTPQRVSLGPGNVPLDPSWSIDSADHAASRSLTADLKSFHALELGRAGAAARNVIRLRIDAGTVAEAPAEVREQAYRIRVAPGLIEITGNGGAGLFYGVQTLVQLARQGPRGQIVLPECEIVDWPQLALRFLHWDTKHHQDRMATLKRYLDWAARFKANMIGFELEDKFAYPSNPEIGAPGAFTPAEMQEIVNYGLERFIQVVPVVQSPAHFSYVLKHPKFAHLKADGNNYQSCLCLEDTYKLIFQMYDDLIAATRGIDYFFVSTDEVYYAGIGSHCKQPYTPETRSAAWAEFARRAHDHLAAKGRRMLAWLEYPLLASDLEKIPSGVIDGVVGDDSFVEVEKRKGMRQLLYNSTQGAEFLFPDHLPIQSYASDSHMGEFEETFTAGRINEIYNSMSSGNRALRMNPIGAFGAAWDDSGLHGETFWLGWSAVARWAWQRGVPGPEQHAAEFMNIFYGPEATGMVGIYRTLQLQARNWQRSWDRVVSRVRGPGYGNSDAKGLGTTRHDLTLPPPSLPDPVTLAIEPRYAGVRGRGFVGSAAAWRIENDQLQHELLENMARASRNQYGLEVFYSLAQFIGHHWRLLSTLDAAERSLERAEESARRGQAENAVALMVEAHNGVARSEDDAEAVWTNLRTVFEKSRWPNGRSVDGRTFLHVLDDTKDHWAGRTPDLGYMFAPERSIGLAAWRDQLMKTIRAYAARNNVAVRGLAERRLQD